MRGLLLFVAFVMTTGCTTVKPWQKGTLAHPSMEPDKGARAVGGGFAEHCFDVREGATGCTGQAGGGCGCN